MINYTLREIAEITAGELAGDPEIRISGVAFDSRYVVAGNMFVPIIGEKVDGHSFVSTLFDQGIAASLWSSTTEVEKPEGNLIIVDDVVSALQKLAKHYRRQLTNHFVGVTGSSGKTGTKDIIAAMLSAGYKVYKTRGNLNNDIGVPVTILNMDEAVDYVVVEMGINDVGVMDRLVDMVEPDITVITSIGPAHIAQLGSLDGVVEQKCLINRDLKDGRCFYNAEAYGVENQLEKMGISSQSTGYGIDKGEVRATDITLSDKGTAFRVDDFAYEIPLLGRHQVLNALSAICIGRYAGLSEQQIGEALAKVHIAPHRLQLKNIRGARIIDDTYNANPLSMAAALHTLSGYGQGYRRVAVLGDMLELGETSYQLHKSLIDSVDFHDYDSIVLIGQQISGLADGLEEQNIPFVRFSGNDQARAYLRKYLTADTVMLFKASNGMHFSALIDSLEEDI